MPKPYVNTITISGPIGSGKTVLMTLISDFLRSKGMKVDLEVEAGTSPALFADGVNNAREALSRATSVDFTHHYVSIAQETTNA